MHKNEKDKILGTGLFLGNDKIVIASTITNPKEGEVYVIKSVLGEQKVSKVIQEKDFTIIELMKTSDTPTDEIKTEEEIPLPSENTTQ